MNNEIITFYTVKGECIGVKVPDDFSYAGSNNDELYYWTETCKPSNGDYPHSVHVPNIKKYELVAIYPRLKEEQAKVLVGDFECPDQWCENGYIDQGYGEKWRCNYCQENEDSDTPSKDILLAIIRSHGIDPNEKRVLLIKEI